MSCSVNLLSNCSMPIFCNALVSNSAAGIVLPIAWDVLICAVLRYAYAKVSNWSFSLSVTLSLYAFWRQALQQNLASERLGVKGSDGYIILGNDGAYLPESFSRRMIPCFTVANSLAAKSLDWLIKCKNDPDCIGVFVNHDPAVAEQTAEVFL